VPVIDPEQSGVSPAIAAIVNRLLQKQPDHRFQSASEVASALREARERPAVAAYSTHDDSPTQPITTLQPPPRPSRLPDRRTLAGDEGTHRRSVGPSIVLVIAALVIAAAAGYFATRPGVPRVTLDNYVGMTDAQAYPAIVNAGLKYTVTRQTSDTVAINHIIGQDPAANTQVPKGSTIALLVSSGKPTVGLRDVTTYMLADAEKDLAYDKFQVKIDHKFDPSPKGTVIAEKPKAGTKLRQGSLVTLVVSDGPAPIKMPRLVGVTIDKARALAARDGFIINVVQTQAINDVPPNVIASQDVPAGSTINSDHSVTVNVVVSTGGGLANVPAVINQDFVTANQALIKAGFDVKIVYMEQLDSADNGHIIQQDPPANTPLEKGNTVSVTLSVPGEVPDTEGMDLHTAQNTLLNAGYTPGNITLTTEGADGKVVRTEPEAGTAARPGTEVSIYVNSANAQPPH
jgi:serine/threonine-protein kinase